MTTSEFACATLFLALLAVLKLANITSLRFDSDEPQHAHVIWAWTRGFVQYRDVFDNHMPLFHLMLAPIYGLIGDDPHIVVYLRLALFPVQIATALAVYQIGAALFSRRVGIWAIIFLGFYPAYHMISLEFRTDNLWALFWLLSVAELISGKIDAPRAARAGVLMGLAFAVSLKSVLLLIALAEAAATSLAIAANSSAPPRKGRVGLLAAAFHVPMALIPVVVISGFALAGVWPQFRYCVFEHNIIPNIDPENHNTRLRWAYPLMLVVVAYGMMRIARADAAEPRARRRAFVFGIVGFYLATLLSFWRLITRQDFLPVTPLAIVICTGALACLSENVAGAERRVMPPPRVWSLFAAVAFVAMVCCIAVTKPLRHPATAREFARLRGVLALTRPDEFVMDSKGETIFRQRCIRAVLEPITLARIKDHQLLDNVAERCVETRTCLAATGPRLKALPQKGREFLSRNFLVIPGGLRVAGGLLHSITPSAAALHFTVEIPAEYNLIAHNKVVPGTLDGTKCQEARFLGAGEHAFVPLSPVSRVQFLWARAVEHHYFPATSTLKDDEGNDR